MKCLPMDTRRGSTSGNESFYFFSSILPCPLSLVLFLFLPIRIRLRADALELGRVFFSCCGVCMCVFVFVFVFLRKDDINDLILNSLNGY